VLITSTEHFGALINLDFDYKKYLSTLASLNFSLTQTWTGAYVEPDADVGPWNTLDPVAESYIAPWARSSTPGNKKGGNKFDLTKFNTTFFDRLKNFVAGESEITCATNANIGSSPEAAKYDIIVEIGLFGGYEQTHESIWEYTPFYPGNNINVPAGSVNRTTVFSLQAPAALLAVQKATVRPTLETTQIHVDHSAYCVCIDALLRYAVLCVQVREIAAAVKDYENVYFQLVSVGTSKMPGATPDWGKAMQSAVPTRNMIAVPVEWSATFSTGPGNENVVLNFGATASPADIIPPLSIPAAAAPAAAASPATSAATYDSLLYSGHPLAYDESGGKPATPDAPGAYRRSYWCGKKHDCTCGTLKRTCA
jgi:hypothetical protein